MPIWFFSTACFQRNVQCDLSDEVAYSRTEPACIAELSQGDRVLVSQNLSAANGHDTVSFQNYTLTMEITSSSTEVMFSILNPATSADIYLKSIVVSLKEPQK